MQKVNPYDEGLSRIRLLAIVLFVLFLGLAANLWQVQVVTESDWQERLSGQSLRTVRVPAARGRILDRNGRILVDNRASYCIAIYLEELVGPATRDNRIDIVETALDELAGLIRLPRQIDRKELAFHLSKRTPLPLVAWEDLNHKAIARLVEHGVTMPGVQVYVQPTRVYSHGDVASHVLGYVGSASPEALREADGENGSGYNYFLPDTLGRRGIEKKMDDVLRGQPGRHKIRVDAVGFKYDAEELSEPEAGRDVYLTLDLRIQRLAESAIQDDRGSCVVMDVRSGDVLALASGPRFNNNDFIPRISQRRWNALRDDPKTPLLHRAVVGQYPPGSTFKPLVAMAALENDRADPEQIYHCAHVFSIGRWDYRCWHTSGHGDIQLRRSIEQSCNVYFFEMGIATGYDYIYHMADAAGFGHKTGIDIDYETRGLLPNDRWKRETQGYGWFEGDTAHLSIGQGALLATPLQMANMTVTLANGGYVCRPRLVHSVGSRGPRRPQAPEIINRMNWSPEHLEVVRGGMEDVVETETGTGRSVRVPGVRMAAKTGTAEYGTPANRRRHAWMILYAPAKDPKYAVAMIVEDASGGGGKVVGPRLNTLMGGIFALEGRSS